jgi:hypothetical protein
MEEFLLASLPVLLGIVAVGITVLVISFTTLEKAQRAARVGAEVPIRYDPMDRQTFAIDSIAMGYGDPYEAVRKMMLSTG